MGRARSIQLARIFGIRVGATPSWFVVLFALILLLYDFFADVLPGSSATAFWVAVAAAFCFELSIVVHEIGHAVVARRYGIGISGIDLWFFGGLAKLDREPDTPGREGAVAAAGPLVTALVVVVCAIVALAAGRGGEWLDAATLTEQSTTPAIALLGWLATSNVFLLAFNLIPAYPLDGGRIARAIAWKVTGDPNRGLRAAARVGLFFSYALIGFGLFLLAVGDGFDGIWFAVLGWFMAQSARGAVASSTFRERIDGVTVADLMDREPVTIPAATPLLDAQEQFFLRYRWPWFAVTDEAGAYRGIVTQDRVDGAVASGQPALPVGDLLDPAAEQDFRVETGTPLEALLGSEGLRALGALMVVDPDGRLSGVVTIEQIRRALSSVV